MPIYEYQCAHCGHRMEALQKVSDAPLLDCPECGHSSLQRLLSAPAFRLKGGGWYETDFKDGKKKNLHSSDAKPAHAKGKKDAKAKGPDKTAKGKD